MSCMKLCSSPNYHPLFFLIFLPRNLHLTHLFQQAVDTWWGPELDFLFLLGNFFLSVETRVHLEKSNIYKLSFLFCHWYLQIRKWWQLQLKAVLNRWTKHCSFSSYLPTKIMVLNLNESNLKLVSRCVRISSVLLLIRNNLWPTWLFVFFQIFHDDLHTEHFRLL